MAPIIPMTLPCQAPCIIPMGPACLARRPAHALLLPASGMHPPPVPRACIALAHSTLRVEVGAGVRGSVIRRWAHSALRVRIRVRVTVTITIGDRVMVTVTVAVRCSRHGRMLSCVCSFDDKELPRLDCVCGLPHKTASTALYDLCVSYCEHAAP